MESIATAFTLFLATMTAPAGNVQTNLTPEQTSSQAHLVAYQDIQIDFLTKAGAVDTGSVCASQRIVSVGPFAACTEAARSMFEETCRHLTGLEDADERQQQLKTMYCSSAQAFQPTVAKIGLATNAELDARFKARQACSEYTLRYQQTGALAHLADRDEACNRYKRVSSR